LRGRPPSCSAPVRASQVVTEVMAFSFLFVCDHMQYHVERKRAPIAKATLVTDIQTRAGI